VAHKEKMKKIEKKSKQEDPEIRVKNTPEFKLKDRPARQFQVINFLKQFGFVPEVIIIEKIRGSNNKLIVRAVLTPEEIKKEDKLKRSLEIPKR